MYVTKNKEQMTLFFKRYHDTEGKMFIYVIEMPVYLSYFIGCDVTAGIKVCFSVT